MSSSFNHKVGEAAKREGMDRAERAANPEWVAFMLAALIEVAKRQPFFYSDDVELVRQNRGGPSTHENRAMGPLMKRAFRAGICEPTDRFAAASRAACHRCPRRIWKSMLYDKTAAAAADWPGVDWPR
jgi:hypothetical protein